MRDEDKTKEQLIGELAEIRRQADALRAEHSRIEKVMRMAIEMTNEEKAKTDAIIAAIGDGISIQDRDFKVLYQNEVHKNLMGDRKGEYCYKAYADNAHVCPGCPVARSFADGRIHVLEKAARRKESDFCVEIKASPLRDSDGKVVAGIEVVRDITERKKAEAALFSAESKFRNLVEQSLIGIYIVRDDRFVYVNPKFAEIVGYTQEELLSSVKVMDLIVEEDRELVAENVSKRLRGEVQSIHYTFRGIRKDGTVVDVEVQGTVTSYDGKRAIIGSLLDISMRRKMEYELQKAQKLESLGVLAGGLAHQFNNILTALTGNIMLAKMYAKPGTEVSDILSEAEKASLKASDLTRQLLTFSKGGAPFTKTLSLKELIRDLTGFVAKESAVRCEAFVPQNLWPVEADEGQIRQAITNLLANACQAMPLGGLVKISAENVIADPALIPSLREGAYVKLAITDQGAGIEKNHMDKIFDPFFTTKQKGSGLGLASAFSIVRSHNGRITVESEVGIGTTFTIYLPAALGKTPEEKAGGKVLLPGDKRILVMDDEDMVRNVIDRMLGQCGCTASFARDGREMIELYRKGMESGRPFDAVIIDLIIAGGMGGKEAVQKLLEVDPHASAIVSSGYSEDLIMSNFREFGFKGVLAKPYNLSELGKVLSEVISGDR
ncbi:MAG: PAS domain S-box protein [Nitrospiraceae bacterium]|nr:PAS domain S-box protein [Nitrospiraceae bacterium]